MFTKKPIKMHLLTQTEEKQMFVSFVPLFTISSGVCRIIFHSLDRGQTYTQK